VLDAQNFGVPQRRRRVFVVGCLGDWESAAKVLFEPYCLSGDNQKSRAKREATTTYSERGVAYGGSDGECADTVTSKWAKGSGGPSGNECGLFVAHKVYETHPADSRVKEMGDVCQTVTSRWGTGGGNVPLVQAYSIREDAKANNFSATPLSVTPALQAMQPSVQSHHAQTFIAGNMAVRRLTPTECERLQGFSDGWTMIPWKKGMSPDGHRYKALGNSMAVPCMKWIGSRIQMIENEGNYKCV
jgi:DNA (cytosine-5)-methyltransferase 1